MPIVKTSYGLKMKILAVTFYLIAIVAAFVTYKTWKEGKAKIKAAENELMLLERKDRNTGK